MKNTNNFSYTNWGESEDKRLLLATIIELRVYKKKNKINLEEIETKASITRQELDDLFSGKIKDLNLLSGFLNRIESLYKKNLFELLNPEQFAIEEDYVETLSNKALKIISGCIGECDLDYELDVANNIVNIHLTNNNSIIKTVNITLDEYNTINEGGSVKEMDVIATILVDISNVEDKNEN